MDFWVNNSMTAPTNPHDGANGNGKQPGGSPLNLGKTHFKGFSCKRCISWGTGSDTPWDWRMKSMEKFIGHG
jgi:hypothetical protein